MKNLIESSKNSGLSVEELFILNLLYYNREELDDYIQKHMLTMPYKTIFSKLRLLKFIDYNLRQYPKTESIVLIKSVEEVNDIVKGLDLEFSKVSDESTFMSQWLEFISLYPKKSGVRPLHNLRDQSRERYRLALKHITHEEVMKGLNTEIRLRKIAKVRKEFFPEWKLLSTYINQKGWEQFLDFEENETEFVENDGRITRRL